MSMTDPIADLLTRVRNGIRAGHLKVDVPSSRMKKGVVQILKDEGYIKNFKFTEDKKQGSLRVYFKPAADKEDRVITDLKRVSRPGLRVYVDHSNLPKVLGGLGTAVISTSHGLMTDAKARKAGIGGEHLFNIW
jgi:small subunit ribosomal protein S8